MPKAGFYPIQFCVVVPWMADELPGTFRQIFDQFRECVGRQSTSRKNPNATIRGHHPRARNCLPEPAPIMTENPELKLPLPMSREGENQRLEGIADRADSAIFCSAKHTVQNYRKDVRVLVRIEVRDPDSRCLQLSNLRSDFGLNLGGIELPHHRVPRKIQDAFTECLPGFVC